MERNANVNLDFPLHWAIRRTNLDIVKYLVENGAEINDCNENGRNSAFVAANIKKPEILKFLIGRGANLDFVDKFGKTALQNSIAENFSDIVEILVEGKADLDLNCPLLKAVGKRNFRIVECLLKGGAKFNSSEEIGIRILRYSSSDSDIKNLLFTFDENPNKNDSFLFETCVVCLSVMNPSEKSLLGPNCQHQFHATCLEEWFIKSRNTNCPLCRAQF